MKLVDLQVIINNEGVLKIDPWRTPFKYCCRILYVKSMLTVIRQAAEMVGHLKKITFDIILKSKILFN